MPNRNPAQDSAPPVQGRRSGRAPRRPAEREPVLAPDRTVAARPPPDRVARIEVDSARPSEHLFRRLLAGYLGGAESFEVVETPRLSPRSRDIVREFCRRTLGPQIVQEAAGILVLAQAKGPDREDWDGRLLRLGQQVLAGLRDAVESWSRLPLGSEEAWARTDDEIDREAWLLERQLGLQGEQGRTASGPLRAAWTVARSLERIADHAASLGELGPALSGLDRSAAPLRELRQFHRQAVEHLEQVLEASDGGRANDLLDVGEALLAGGRALSDRFLPAVGDGRMSPATSAAVARAFEAVGRTVAYSQDIAEAFLDRAMCPAARARRETAVPVAPLVA